MYMCGMCVSMYVVCACGMWGCLYTYVCIFMYLCVWCMYLCVWCVCVAYVCASMCGVYLYTCVYAYLWVYTCVYLHVYVCVWCVYVYLCVCVWCVCVSVSRRLCPFIFQILRSQCENDLLLLTSLVIVFPLLGHSVQNRFSILLASMAVSPSPADLDMTPPLPSQTTCNWLCDRCHHCHSKNKTMERPLLRSLKPKTGQYTFP